jgi:hypothetical protein
MEKNFGSDCTRLINGRFRRWQEAKCALDDWPVWSGNGTVIDVRQATESEPFCKAEIREANRRLGMPEAAMDVGITHSQRSSVFHWITGLFVVTVGYSAVMFAVRALMMG